MNAFLITALTLAGVAAGWVQRAVIFWLAVPVGEPRRQACPGCGHQLLHARPLPWPVLAPSGRCPACRARTGPPPLATELTTAFLLGGLGARVHPGLVLAAAAWLAVCAVPLGWIDAAVHRLPDVLTLPAYAGTVGFLLLDAASSGHWHNFVRAALGGCAAAAFYLAIALVTPSGMGVGDAKLAASLGSLLAWYGWRTLLAGAFAGFLLGGLYACALLVLHRATRRQHIPFGPFMITGTLLVILAVGV